MTGLETCPKSARDVVLATNVHSVASVLSASKCFLRTTSRPCSAPPWEHHLRSDRGILDREDKKTFLQSQLLSLKKRNLACGHLLRGLIVHKRGELVQVQDVDAWVSC